MCCKPNFHSGNKLNYRHPAQYAANVWPKEPKCFIKVAGTAKVPQPTVGRSRQRRCDGDGDGDWYGA